MGLFKKIFKVAAVALGVAAVVFTAGAALGVAGAVGGWGAASASLGSTLGGSGMLGGIITGALQFGGMGAITGGIAAALGKKNIVDGMTMGAITGGLLGGIAGGINATTGWNPLGVATKATDIVAPASTTQNAATEASNLASPATDTVSGSNASTGMVGATGTDTMGQNGGLLSTAQAQSGGAVAGATPSVDEQIKLATLKTLTKSAADTPWYNTEIAKGGISGLVGLAQNMGKDPNQQLETAQFQAQTVANNYGNPTPASAPGLLPNAAQASGQIGTPAQGAGDYQFVPGQGIRYILRKPATQGVTP